MRQVEPERPRPFRIGGGLVVARALAYTFFAVLALLIFLSVYTPGDVVLWPVLLGAVTMIALGEIAIRVAEHQKRNSR